MQIILKIKNSLQEKKEKVTKEYVDLIDSLLNKK